MDPVTLSIAGAGVALIARLIGEALAAGDNAKAERLKQQAIADYGEEILPQLEQATAQDGGATELGSISVDPSGRNAQVSALEKLAAFGEGGFTPEDAAEQRRVMDAAAGVASRQAAQGEQLAAARGLQRSGLSQALGQQAAQAGAQTAADSASQLAAQRRARQLQALGMMGSQGGALRGADYGEQADRATAQDAINRFNANMRASALDARNRNAMNAYNANMQRLDSRNRARGTLADQYSQQANQTRQTASDIGTGIQGGMQGGADYMSEAELRKLKYSGGK